MEGNKKKVIFITGGARSGKSRYAQELALQLSAHPIYVATARQWDGDFQDRIRRHRQERDGRWSSIEEEKQLSRLDLQGIGGDLLCWQAVTPPGNFLGSCCHAADLPAEPLPALSRLCLRARAALRSKPDD